MLLHICMHVTVCVIHQGLPSQIKLVVTYKLSMDSESQKPKKRMPDSV